MTTKVLIPVQLTEAISKQSAPRIKVTTNMLSQKDGHTVELNKPGMEGVKIITCLISGETANFKYLPQISLAPCMWLHFPLYVTELWAFSQASRISIISFFFSKKEYPWWIVLQKRKNILKEHKKRKNILGGLSFKKEKISSRSIKKERKITGLAFSCASSLRAGLAAKHLAK
jgi:hypothetical protein